MQSLEAAAPEAAAPEAAAEEEPFPLCVDASGDYHSEALKAVKEYRAAIAAQADAKAAAAKASNAKAKASVTFRGVGKGEARPGTPHYQPLKSVLAHQGGGPLGCVTDALGAVGKLVAGWCGGA